MLTGVMRCKLLGLLQLNELPAIQVAGMKFFNFEWDSCEQTAADFALQRVVRYAATMS